MYYSVRLSSFTLSQLDSLLSINPLLAKMSKASRLNLYNFAQEEIAKLRGGLGISQLPPTTTTDNKLLFVESETDNRYLYALKQEDLEDLRGSLFTLEYVDEILDQHIILNALNKKQRTELYNLAQQSIANIRNKYLDDEYTINTVSYDKTEATTGNFVISPTTTIELHIVDDQSFTTIVAPSCTFSYVRRSLQDSLFETTLTNNISFSYSISGGNTTGQTFETAFEPSISYNAIAHTIFTKNVTTEGSVAISYNVTGP